MRRPRRLSWILPLLILLATSAPLLAQCEANLRPGVSDYHTDLNQSIGDYGALLYDAANPSCRYQVPSLLDTKLKNQMYYASGGVVYSGFSNKWLGGGDISLLTLTALELGAQGLLSAELDRKIQCAISNYNFVLDPNFACNASNGNSCIDDYTVAVLGFGWAAAYEAFSGHYQEAQNRYYGAKSYFHAAFSTSQSVCIRSTANACNVCSNPSATDLYNGLIGTPGYTPYEVIAFNHSIENPSYGVGLFTSLSGGLEGLRRIGYDVTDLSDYEKLLAQGLFLQGQKRVAGGHFTNTCYDLNSSCSPTAACEDGFRYRPDMYPVKRFTFDKFALPSSTYPLQVISPSGFQFDSFRKTGDAGVDNGFSGEKYFFNDARLAVYRDLSWVWPYSYRSVTEPGNYPAFNPIDNTPPFNGQEPALAGPAADYNYPEIWVDSPAYAETVTATKDFSGWAIDRESDLASIYFYIDGSPIYTLAYGDYRYDVCQAKNIFTCDPYCRVGWRGSFNPANYASGGHTLRVMATDRAGHTTTYDRFFYSQSPYGGSCAHSECITGNPLTNGCSSCVSTICSYDSYCCTWGWDGLCVNEAQRDCPGVCN